MTKIADGYDEPAMQLHLAEYGAITARITNWITLQFAIAPIIGGVLVLLADARGLFPLIVMVWVVAIIIDIGIAAYLYTLYEMMNNAKYIECKLTSLIGMEQVPFWQYEHYRSSNHAYSPAGIYLTAVVGILVPWIALLLHCLLWPPLLWWGDAAGVLACSGIAIWGCIIAKKGSQAQRDLWICAMQRNQRLPGSLNNQSTGGAGNPSHPTSAAEQSSGGVSGQPQPQPDRNRASHDPAG